MILSPEEAARQSWAAYEAAMDKYILLHRSLPDKILPEAHAPFRAWWEICEAVIAFSSLGRAHNPLDHTAKGKPHGR